MLIELLRAMLFALVALIAYQGLKTPSLSIWKGLLCWMAIVVGVFEVLAAVFIAARAPEVWGAAREVWWGSIVLACYVGWNSTAWIYDRRADT